MLYILLASIDPMLPKLISQVAIEGQRTFRRLLRHSKLDRYVEQTRYVYMLQTGQVGSACQAPKRRLDRQRLSTYRRLGNQKRLGRHSRLQVSIQVSQICMINTCIEDKVHPCIVDKVCRYPGKEDQLQQTIGS